MKRTENAQTIQNALARSRQNRSLVHETGTLLIYIESVYRAMQLDQNFGHVVYQNNKKIYDWKDQI